MKNIIDKHGENYKDMTELIFALTIKGSDWAAMAYMGERHMFYKENV